MSSRWGEMLTLMYHGLNPGDGRYGDAHPGELAYVLAQETFRRHLEILARSGREVVAPNDFLENKDVASGKRASVLLTFDDGMRSDYDVALPLLRQRGLQGLFFITTGEVGRPGRVEWRHLREMADAGMAIGSHGETHRLFSGMRAEEQRAEMERSRKALEDGLGVGVGALSLPGGRSTRRTLALARECGYKAVFTSEPTMRTREKDGLAVVGRVAVQRDWDEAYFDEFLKSAEAWTDRMRKVYRVKRFVQGVLGDRAYGALHRTAWRKKR